MLHSHFTSFFYSSYHDVISQKINLQILLLIKNSLKKANQNLIILSKKHTQLKLGQKRLINTDISKKVYYSVFSRETLHKITTLFKRCKLYITQIPDKRGTINLICNKFPNPLYFNARFSSKIKLFIEKL